MTIRTTEEWVELIKKAKTPKELDGVWLWQGDEEDHLESLSCPILIDAQDLRDLLGEVKKAERERLISVSQAMMITWGGEPYDFFCVPVNELFETKESPKAKRYGLPADASQRQM